MRIKTTTHENKNKLSKNIKWTSDEEIKNKTKHLGKKSRSERKRKKKITKWIEKMKRVTRPLRVN